MESEKSTYHCKEEETLSEIYFTSISLDCESFIWNFHDHIEQLLGALEQGEANKITNRDVGGE